MKRWVFNIAAGLSLVMCLAAVAMWVRSRSHYDGKRLGNPKRFIVLRSYRNYVGCKVGRQRGLPVPDTFDAISRSGNILPKPRSVGRLGFYVEWGYSLENWHGDGYAYPTRYWAADVPYWSVVIISALLPSLWLIRTRNTTLRRRLGLCPRCNYDLRATSDRCPECGTPVPAGHVATITPNPTPIKPT